MTIVTMRQMILASLVCLFSASPAVSQQTQPDRLDYQGRSYPLYPATLHTCPEVPSPFTDKNGMEIVVAYRAVDSTYTLIPVTVEDGEPLNYREGQWGKGRQLEVDEEDFPTLARTGLHSRAELDQTRTITGRTVEDITENGRPEQSSFAGFMAADEDIVSVLKGDNHLVSRMGMTHPELARPMFHLWNIVRSHYQQMLLAGEWLPGIDWFSYRGHTVHLLDAGHGHGWQTSIFNDSILGMYQIEIRRDMRPQEEAFLRQAYSRLDAEQIEELIRRLSYVHLGEMVAYYIMRYGFYEGHTTYRADPIAIAFVFGLRTIEEIESAFDGHLFHALTMHFTRESVDAGSPPWER